MENKKISPLISTNKYDVLLPMEQWDGECWKGLFGWFEANSPHVDPWDMLAGFINLTLMKGEDNAEENAERTDS